LPLKQLMANYQQRVEVCLERCLPAASLAPQTLHEAMRYAVLGGGKRIRPFLVYAAGTAVGARLEDLDMPACAVELVHAYSLVHDDLPAMDDDDLRRGKPTCHKAFDEATAILAGDALQSLAFALLSDTQCTEGDAARQCRMINTLALAGGSRGMAGGQAMDLAAEGRTLDIAQLEDMHIHKTGALIRASVTLGALGSPFCDEDRLQQLDHYAKCIGLAFQVRDDILDEEADTATLGKPQGSDLARQKSTYPSVLGLEEAKRTAQELCDDALASLESFGAEADPLRLMAGYIVERHF